MFHFNERFAEETNPGRIGDIIAAPLGWLVAPVTARLPNTQKEHFAD